MKTMEMCKSTIEHLLESDNQAERLVGALCTMNMDCVDAEIKEGILCNNVSRFEFFSQLTAVFEESKKAGDRFFKVYSGHSRSATPLQAGEKCYLFVGNVTGNHFGLKFDSKNGSVVSFYQCVSIRSSFANKPGSILLHLTPLPF